MITDKDGNLFEDRRKKDRRKENVAVKEERRVGERRKATEKK